MVEIFRAGVELFKVPLGTASAVPLRSVAPPAHRRI